MPGVCFHVHIDASNHLIRQTVILELHHLAELLPKALADASNLLVSASMVCWEVELQVLAILPACMA